MSLTLRKLLLNPSLHLRVVVGLDGEQGHESALDREFAWLHATDMIDPTPFLGPAEVILTLGWQFPVVDSADPAVPEVSVSATRLAEIYDDYAALVAAYGVIGIGFGSDVLHRGVPTPLAEACAKHGLILFDVPYEISFMDLLQEASRVMQRDETERYSRSLRAQKAIANAATRRDGLNATLRETARQLGCGVVLFDALARAVTRVTAPDGAAEDLASISELVKSVLATGQRFKSVQLTPETEVVLQLLGEPEEPSGVLALTLSGVFDDVSRNVLSSVLALVTVSLQQNQALQQVYRSLRQALLQLLLSGDVEVTRHIVTSVWGELPQPPLIVLVGIPQQFDSSRVLPALEAMPAWESGSFFFAPNREEIAMLVSEAQLDVLVEELQPLGLVLGQSRCERWSDLEAALGQARKAADVGIRRGAKRVTQFSEIWRQGMSDLMEPASATMVAERLLGPILDHDDRESGVLLATLSLWLEQRGRTQSTARELGIHRHTVDARLKQISMLTGLDLDDALVRAELIFATRLLNR